MELEGSCGIPLRFKISVLKSFRFDIRYFYLNNNGISNVSDQKIANQTNEPIFMEVGKEYHRSKQRQIEKDFTSKSVFNPISKLYVELLKSQCSSPVPYRKHLTRMLIAKILTDGYFQLSFYISA